MGIFRTVASITIVGVVGMSVIAPPAQATPQIDVTPSANGLVMMGVPAVITPSGYRGKAKIIRLDERSGTWQYMGETTASKPITYTFPRYGRIKVKVVPKGQRARTVVVPVHGRFVTTTDPMTYGDVQLPNGRPVSAFDPPWTAPASAGCSRLDVGILVMAQPGQSGSGTLLVHSSGAPDTRLPVTDGGAVLLGVPVQGDISVSVVDYVNPADRESKAGVVWYCTGPIRLVEIPS